MKHQEGAGRWSENLSGGGISRKGIGLWSLAAWCGPMAFGGEDLGHGTHTDQVLWDGAGCGVSFDDAIDRSRV